MDFAFTPLHYRLKLVCLDYQDFKFSGKVDILGQLSAAAVDSKDTVKLAVHSRDLEWTHVTLNGTSISLDACTTDAEEELVHITVLRSLITGSTFNLSISYKGVISNASNGFYRFHGSAVGAATHFEPVYARRAFPCIDHPAAKAPFDVAIVAPADFTVLSCGVLDTIVDEPLENLQGQTVVGPKLSSRTTPRRHTFHTSVRLPTYLLAWCIGDFSPVRLEGAPPTSIPIVGWFPDNRSAPLGQTFTAASVEAWAYYERLFNTRVALPKLDVVALPTFPIGGMENFGLIHLTPNALLSSTATATEEARILALATHEVSHMWFGSSVTPLWWDELWLKEGFASFVQWLPLMCTDVDDIANGITAPGCAADADLLAAAAAAAGVPLPALPAEYPTDAPPSWAPCNLPGTPVCNTSTGPSALRKAVIRPMERWANVGRSTALNLDAWRSTHALSSGARTVAECQEVFDGLSYNKGSTFVHMMWRLFGHTTFAGVLGQYLNAFALGNANAGHLTAFLAAALPVPMRSAFKALVTSWTEQAGYPLVVAEVTTAAGGGHALALSQSHFVLSSDELWEGGDGAAFGRGRSVDTVWDIPVLTATSDGASRRPLKLCAGGARFVVVSARSDSIALPADYNPAHAVVVNVDAAVPAAVWYGPVAWRALQRSIVATVEKLRPWTPATAAATPTASEDSLDVPLSTVDIIAMLQEGYNFVRTASVRVRGSVPAADAVDRFVWMLTVLSTANDPYIADVVFGYAVELMALTERTVGGAAAANVRAAVRALVAPRVSLLTYYFTPSSPEDRKSLPLAPRHVTPLLLTLFEALSASDPAAAAALSAPLLNAPTEAALAELAGGLTTAIATCVASQPDGAQFARDLFAVWKTLPPTHSHRTVALLAALSTSSEADLLDMCVTCLGPEGTTDQNEARLGFSEFAILFAGVAANPTHRGLAWHIFKRHFAIIELAWGSSQFELKRLIAAALGVATAVDTTRRATPDEIADDVTAFFTKHHCPVAAMAVAQCVETLRSAGTLAGMMENGGDNLLARKWPTVEEAMQLA